MRSRPVEDVLLQTLRDLRPESLTARRFFSDQFRTAEEEWLVHIERIEPRPFGFVLTTVIRDFTKDFAEFKTKLATVWRVFTGQTFAGPEAEIRKAKKKTKIRL
jgi:hypothetical protein